MFYPLGWVPVAEEETDKKDMAGVNALEMYTGHIGTLVPVLC